MVGQTKGTRSLAKSMHQINHCTTHCPAGPAAKPPGASAPVSAKWGPWLGALKGNDCQVRSTVLGTREVRHAQGGVRTRPGLTVWQEASPGERTVAASPFGDRASVGIRKTGSGAREQSCLWSGQLSPPSRLRWLKSAGCRRAADTSVRTRPGTALQTAESEVLLGRVTP